MRRILIKSILILILYTLVNLYFAVFNWKIFTVKLNTDLGFAVVEFPPFIILFLLGLILIGIHSWMNYVLRLRKMIVDLEQGMEIGRLKDKLFSNKFRNFIFDENNLKILKEKLGISELEKRQEDLIKMVSGMKPESERKD
jgi:hypothetical protein